jgi:hypothetical protein
LKSPRTVIPILLFSAAPALADPLPNDAAPKELLALRSKLVEAGREAALSDVPRFRPLCDPEGYPLVGNVIRKAVTFQPSEFCAEVRQRAAK